MTKKNLEIKALEQIQKELSDELKLADDFWIKERIKFTLFLATALLKEKEKKNENTMQHLRQKR